MNANLTKLAFASLFTLIGFAPLHAADNKKNTDSSVSKSTSTATSQGLSRVTNSVNSIRQSDPPQVRTSTTTAREISRQENRKEQAHQREISQKYGTSKIKVPSPKN